MSNDTLIFSFGLENISWALSIDRVNFNCGPEAVDLNFFSQVRQPGRLAARQQQRQVVNLIYS